MKKTLLLSVLLSILILSAQAQFEPDQIKYSKAVFLELGGNGALFSANYEMRFKKGKQDGLGFRAGLGGIRFLNVGYRFQPIENGFLFKINWTPVISGGRFEPRWFGISLGYGFK